jgi:hypothetical protein
MSWLFKLVASYTTAQLYQAFTEATMLAADRGRYGKIMIDCA